MDNKTTLNGIELSKYFKNHYDSWGRLYCVEYKGNPLELQNAIKHLQKENEELKKRQITKNGFICDCEQNAKYREALEKIREIALKKEYLSLFECLDDIWDITNKALNEVLK